MKNKPLTPHLNIFKSEIPALFSILKRITIFFLIIIFFSIICIYLFELYSFFYGIFTYILFKVSYYPTYYNYTADSLFYVNNSPFLNIFVLKANLGIPSIEVLIMYYFKFLIKYWIGVPLEQFIWFLSNCFPSWQKIFNINIFLLASLNYLVLSFTFFIISSGFHSHDIRYYSLKKVRKDIFFIIFFCYTLTFILTVFVIYLYF